MLIALICSQTKPARTLMFRCQMFGLARMSRSRAIVALTTLEPIRLEQDNEEMTRTR